MRLDEEIFTFLDSLSSIFIQFILNQLNVIINLFIFLVNME